MEKTCEIRIGMNWIQPKTEWRNNLKRCDYDNYWTWVRLCKKEWEADLEKFSPTKNLHNKLGL